MNLNNLFKIFLKQREKSINVNIVNNYHSYPDNSYQDNGYFDNIYNVNDNSYYVNTQQSNNYYQEYNTQEPYEIPSHDVFLLEDVQQIPPNKIIIGISVIIGIFLMLYWASKITNEQTLEINTQATQNANQIKSTHQDSVIVPVYDLKEKIDKKKDQ